MSIIELCDLTNSNHLIYPNFKLSKIMKPNETYPLTRQNVHRLKEINEHNAILSQPGRDGFGRKINRLTYSLPNVNDIDFSRNYIKSIPKGFLPNNTRKLNISHNILFNIDGIIQNTNELRSLNCSHNAIKSIPPLPRNLENLKSNNCNLQSIPELPNTLQTLIINDNNIDRIPNSILQCNNLNDLNYENNPNIQVSEEILEFIQNIFERIRERRERNQLINEVRQGLDNTKRTVANDSQNVHDVKVRVEVANAIKKLMQDKCEISEYDALKQFGKVIGADVEQEVFDNNKKSCFGTKKKNNNNLHKVNDIQEFDVNNWSVNFSNNPNEDYEYLKKVYSYPTKCSISEATFPILFKYFWNRLVQSKNREDILKVFIKEDIPEMKIVCFVGRISRVINCLSGFFDDISVGISLKQQIELKYNIVAKKYKSFIEEPLKYSILCYYHFKDLLDELNLEDEIKENWLYPFIETIEEEMQTNENKDIILMNIDPKIRNKFNEDYSNEIFVS